MNGKREPLYIVGVRQESSWRSLRVTPDECNGKHLEAVTQRITDLGTGFEDGTP